LDGVVFATENMTTNTQYLEIGMHTFGLNEYTEEDFIDTLTDVYLDKDYNVNLGT
jgi:hypothetical protein